MLESVLFYVYTMVFNEVFNPSQIIDRERFSTMIYFMQTEGTYSGYAFLLMTYGVRSLSLEEELKRGKKPEKTTATYRLTDDSANEILKIKNLITNSLTDEVADQIQWLKNLRAVDFVKRNVLSSTATKDEVIQEFKKRLPHLYEAEVTNSAYERITEHLYH